MPRASRIYAPGQVFHITHRCHKREFLLKFKQDRERYRYWLYEARKRYRFCVLNYMITSNHIHLLVMCTTKDIIPSSMQLVAGRTAQEYNLRKKRNGAFWEDRYHVSVVEADEYFHRCFIYIDLNMVRTGRVQNPLDWEYCGYYELFYGRQRYQVLSVTVVLELLGYHSIEEFRDNHSLLIKELLKENKLSREPFWTENKVIGTELFQQKFALT
ncbi:TPA: transposase [Legionella pneumophila]|nr:transposase [Legionella pneumophila]HAU0833423.1 transposase [Legionella pneumophila]HAU0960232.1 transposase [Legionella pneumophila]